MSISLFVLSITLVMTNGSRVTIESKQRMELTACANMRDATVQMLQADEVAYIIANCKPVAKLD